jgi:hypothetical protein
MIGVHWVSMGREVKLSRIVPLFSDLDYPMSRDTVVNQHGDLTLRLADGTVNFGDLIADSDSETFDSVDDLVLVVMNLLPRRAVGEPYQSEGEG